MFSTQTEATAHATLPLSSSQDTMSRMMASGAFRFIGYSHAESAFMFEHTLTPSVLAVHVN